MKKLLLVSCLFLIAIGALADGGNTIINATKVKQVTFEGDNVNIKYNDGTVETDDMGDVVLTFAPETSSIKGDANGDGKVDVEDVVGIVNKILGEPAANFVEANADLNGDGKIDVDDVVAVVNIILEGNSATNAPLLARAADNAQSWSFATVSANDKTNLDADTRMWSYDSSNNRWLLQTSLEDAPLTANGSELEFTKGLTFTTTAADYVRVDAKKGSLTLNNKLAIVTIHQVKAGQILTIESQSSSKTTARTLTATNIEVTGGFTESTDRMTHTGKVIADGDIAIQSTGGMYVYSIKVADESETTEEPQPQEPANDYSTQSNTQKNQAVMTLTDGTKRFYNTESVSSIDFEGTNVTVNQQAGNYTFQGTVVTIAFNKADNSGQGEIVNPEGAVQITESKGWLESAYVKFNLLEGAKAYNIYIKGGQYADFTMIDQQLVRNYGTYGRADVVGLKAATDYSIKVVPVNANGQELAANASTASNIEVRNYSREGFAFLNGYEPGAYKSDGTLKQNAKVLYVTKNTAKTITTSVVTDTKGGTTECTGLQAIIAAYEKGCDTTPIAFRFIGLVQKGDLDAVGSSEEGIQVKGRKADAELNFTFEGIGDDATIKGFGFLVRNAKSVEFRNLGIMRCMDDGLSLDTDNSNIWIHHTDVFYGPNGGGDHAKGDGATDVKSDSKYVTVSYNRYWDTGKTNMFGMKSESGPNYISYDHNWFDHSDSRHPRVRTMSVHVWNNYFDNVAKYGVGATTGASVFVENNYFLKTKKPILASLQGTDGLGSGTFSGENGGMIKAYGNYFDRSAAHFSYYTQKSPSAKGYDAYETATRDEQVPETEVTLVGGTKYNNFDTNASLMYTYTVAAAEDVPAIVTGYYGAGRMNHGDFQYTFKDNVGLDDDDSAYDATLGGLLDNYTSSLVGFFGEESQGSGEQGGQGGEQGGQGGEQGGQGGEQGSQGGEQGGNTPSPATTILASFDGSPSNSMFTIAGDYGDGKITYNGAYYKKGVKLNSKGSITFTPTANYNMVIVMATAKNGRDVRINGELTTVSGTLYSESLYYELEPIAITAGTQYVLTKGSDEGILMLIKLEPVE